MAIRSLERNRKFGGPGLGLFFSAKAARLTEVKVYHVTHMEGYMGDGQVTTMANESVMSLNIPC